MDIKTVYQTDHLGIYVGAVQADPSPLEPDVWLIPGGCVEAAPPAIPERKAALWRGDRWQLVDDYQGLTAYHVETREPLQITRHGPLPAMHTLLAPGLGQIWQEGEWVDDLPAVLAALHAEKLQAIQANCKGAMTGGFRSSALGETHRYPSQLEDQFHLTGIVLSGLEGPLDCTDAEGVSDYRLHSPEQLAQVSKDFIQHRLKLLQQSHELKQQLDNALADQDFKAMSAIHWSVDP